MFEQRYDKKMSVFNMHFLYSANTLSIDIHCFLLIFFYHIEILKGKTLRFYKIIKFNTMFYYFRIFYVILFSIISVLYILVS